MIYNYFKKVILLLRNSIKKVGYILIWIQINFYKT